MNYYLSAFFCGHKTDWDKLVKHKCTLKLVKEVPDPVGASMGKPATKIVEVPVESVGTSAGFMNRLGDSYFTDGSINKPGIQQLNSEFSDTIGAQIKLKSISLKMDGSNPSTARRDISAEVKFELTDLRWLDRVIKTRVDGDDYYWKLVDLMSYPTSYQQSKGFGKVFKRQYNPSYNRLRLTLEPYIVDSALNGGTSKMLGSKGPPGTVSGINREGDYWDYTEVVSESFENSALDINLALIEHSFNIGAKDEDVRQMTYELTIKYAGYFETAMNAPYTDGLADYDTIRSRRKQEETMEKQLRSADCPDNVVRQLMAKMEEQIVAETKLAKASILKRALLRSKVHKVEFSKAAVARLLLRNGTITNATELWKSANIAISTMDVGVGSKPTASGDVDKSNPDVKAVMSDGAPEPDNTDSADKKEVETAAQASVSVKTPIYFFYLGDLLEIISDCLYKEKKTYDNNRSEMGEGLEYLNMFFMTSTFQYGALSGINVGGASASTSIHTINIADIPISITYFREWYEEAVVKKDLPYYSAINMMRDIMEKVVTNLLGEVCFNGAGEKKLRFRVAYVSTAPELIDGVNSDPLFTRWKSIAKTADVKNSIGVGDFVYDNERAELDLTKGTTYSMLPLLKRGPEVNVGNFYNYAIIYAQDSNVYEEENNQGLLFPESSIKIDGHYRSLIPHLSVGKSIGGAVNLATFTRTDAPFLREARYFNGGPGNLSQLTNVYDVKLELAGNTWFYPGQLIWVEMDDLNNWGEENLSLKTFGATGHRLKVGSPANPLSMAHNLGLGGYHVVKSVSQTWDSESSTLKTSIEASWVYAGAPGEYRRFDTKEPPKITQTPKACQNLLDKQDARLAGAEAANAVKDASPAKAGGVFSPGGNN